MKPKKLTRDLVCMVQQARLFVSLRILGIKDTWIQRQHESQGFQRFQPRPYIMEAVSPGST